MSHEFWDENAPKHMGSPANIVTAIDCIKDRIRSLRNEFTLETFERALILIGEEARQNALARREKWLKVHKEARK